MTARLPRKRMVAAGLLLAVLLVSGLLLSGASRAEDAADPVVGERNGLTVTASQVRQMIQAADPDLRKQMQHDPAVLAQKVRERLLLMSVLKEAQNENWDERPDVRFRAEVARQNAIVDSYVAAHVTLEPGYPSDEQLQTAYDANKSKLMLPRQYHLAQLFISAPQAGGVAVDADGLRRINELRSQVLKQKQDFAAVAKKSSEDKNSAPNGGELGWLREDAVIPPIRVAVSGLSDGAISDPIRSNEGWHVVKVIATKAAAPASLTEARETLTRALRLEKLQQNQRNYVANLLSKEPIKVNEIEVGKLILAQ
jgi:parvulin-like peptidyl-prolyl isomerase